MPKVALVTTQVEEFESIDALEHYVKEHSPLDFDDKVDLLSSKKIIIDGVDNVSTTVEILNEFAPTDEATVKQGDNDGPEI